MILKKKKQKTKKEKQYDEHGVYLYPNKFAWLTFPILLKEAPQKTVLEHWLRNPSTPRTVRGSSSPVSIVWDFSIRPVPYHDSSFSLFGVLRSTLLPAAMNQHSTRNSPLLTALGWVSHILSSLRHCLRMVLVRTYYCFHCSNLYSKYWNLRYRVTPCSPICDLHHTRRSD